MLRFRLRLLLLAIFCGVFVQLAQGCWFGNVSAVSQDGAWLWAGEKPTVVSVKDATGAAPVSCRGLFESRFIDGETGQKLVCFTAGDQVSFGSYYLSGSLYRAVISFAGDEKMYKVYGVCEDFNDCLYLPETDMLVSKQHYYTPWAHSLVVYKNVTGRLEVESAPGSISSKAYRFDASDPDYVFRNYLSEGVPKDGFAWSVVATAASKNGKWLAVEFNSRGIGLLNTETFVMRRISEWSVQYGYGYNPSYELAVSNNGRNVMTMGVNAPLEVFDVNDACGDIATYANMSNISPVAVPCPKAPIDLDGLIYRPEFGRDSVMSDDGGEISFTLASYTGAQNRVVLRSVGYEGKRLDYLALGDSFVSGEGELDSSYYMAGTNTGYEKCHLGARSYPYQIASRYMLKASAAYNVACSGAMMRDIFGDNNNDYWGQGDRLFKKDINVGTAERNSLQSVAIDSFLPGRAYQVNFVEKYQPGVITIGIGGNDAGFMQKLQACLAPGTCEWAATDEGKEKTAVEIRGLFDGLVKTYQTVHRASPNSKIFVVGYPKIIDESGTCDGLTNLLLDDKEKVFMNMGVQYLNQVISAAASSVGVRYIDVYDSFGDGVLCGSGTPSSMNAVRAGDDISPLSFADWFKVIGQESFHPTPVGHANIAGSFVAAAGQDLFDYGYKPFCGYLILLCPLAPFIPEPLAEYWIPNGYHSYPLQKASDYISDIEGSKDGLGKSISLKTGSLMPGSTFDVEITPNHVVLGQFAVPQTGSIIADIELPADLDEGFHTIHIIGTAPDDSAVDLYQVIKYEKPVSEPEPEQATGPTTDPTPAPGSAPTPEFKPTSSSYSVSTLNLDAGSTATSGTDDGLIFIPTFLTDMPAIKGASTGANVPAAAIPQQPAGGTVQYWTIALVGVILTTSLMVRYYLKRKNSNK